MKILLIAEHKNDSLKLSIANTLTAAKCLGSDIDILIAGYHCEKLAEKAAKLSDVKNIFVADAPEYAHQLAENMALLIAEIGKSYHYILMSDTPFGKNILPRVAALLDVGMISDVIKINGPDEFVRPIYAGNALTTVKSNDSIKILSIRSTAFSPTPVSDVNSASIEKINIIFSNHVAHFESEELHTSERPELGAADIVISGGRGLKSAENFKLLETLADKLGAAIGASRAAVDAGFAPNDFQVGQTGKVVAPKLYIAIGISGAIQHLAGMKDSKVIVAINNDPEAPIFQIADYGLVADLFTSIQELQHELDKPS